MRCLKYITGLIVFAMLVFGCKQKQEILKIIPGHSHNDYEHAHPLFDALDCHFKSIEADVFSIDDSLFVSHNFEDIKPGRTLQKMYLEPLEEQIEKNNGSVYGDGEEVILFIDIKDDALRTYKLLDKILTGYKSMLTVFQNGKKRKGSIMVVVSGERPFQYMKEQNIRYAGYDGRLSDLNTGISPTLMPVVSNSWGEYFTWNGEGEINGEEKEKLKALADKAIDKGYILRFWGTPKKTETQRNAVWQELKSAKVGLIGADNLKELQYFFTTNY